MTIESVLLSNGHCSLELAVGDLDALAAAIVRAYGAPEVEHKPAFTLYTFGGESFVFQNEWDDPCLISRSAGGDRILRNLAALLAAGPKPPESS